MNKDDIRKDIAKSWYFTKALNVGQIFSNPAPLLPSDEFISASIDEEILYEQLYLVGLANGDYNILLSDYSFLQFGWSEADHVRYAYYPNPFIGSSPQAISELGELREYVEEGLITIEEYLAKVSEVRKSQHPPLIRYENAPSQYAHLTHPCSHFHLGHHSENRWPVRRALTPLAFSLMVTRQFYANDWLSAGELKLFEKIQGPNDFLADVKIQCRVLPDELFSYLEQKMFYFG